MTPEQEAELTALVGWHDAEQYGEICIFDFSIPERVDGVIEWVGKRIAGCSWEAVLQQVRQMMSGGNA
jgi:hypothetical protein